METDIATPATIIDFWRAAGPEHWFRKDAAFDQAIRDRFMTTWQAAASGALSSWQATYDGTLALILVLDQFPRNMFRDSARAFSTDAAALAIAKSAIERGVAGRVDPDMVQFVYMPLMHSEHPDDQAACVALFRNHGNADNLKFAEIHADIIRKFGRFPHRNALLGRKSTPDETAFLDDGGFSG